MTLERLLAHPTLVRLAAALASQPGRTIEAVAPARRAAIALIFRLGPENEPELLMIKRAELDRDPWSGHVACPGGREEPGDSDLEHTAARETMEETGIDLVGDGRILGTLDDLSPSTPSLPPLVIRPFVAAVPSDVHVTASPEVAAAFWVPLAALRETASWQMETVQVRGQSRRVSAFLHGDYLVWGLTERVLRQLLQRLE